MFDLDAIELCEEPVLVAVARLGYPEVDGGKGREACVAPVPSARHGFRPEGQFLVHRVKLARTDLSA